MSLSQVDKFLTSLTQDWPLRALVRFLVKFWCQVPIEQSRISLCCGVPLPPLLPLTFGNGTYDCSFQIFKSVSVSLRNYIPIIVHVQKFPRRKRKFYKF